MLNDCIFCAILAGEIPSSKVYENDYVFAFRDINPQAPVHILVVPKKHIACALDIDGENAVYVAKCFEAIAKIAAEKENAAIASFRILSKTSLISQRSARDQSHADL